MYWGHMNGWGIAFMVVQMLLFWGLIVTGIVLVVRYVSGERRPAAPPPPPPPPDSQAELLLAGRYARGEIDDEEYQRRLTVLRTHSASR